ncbi:hypothetical protein ACT453_53955, partial [Bacillus sp. D-CC]
GGRFSVLTPVGLLPIAVSGLNIEEMMKGAAAGHDDFSTDLHSLGQYVQEGRRDLFETVLKVGKSTHELTIESEENDLDGLNYLA